jgi:plastocyanin domain-containing protein
MSSRIAALRPAPAQRAAAQQARAHRAVLTAVAGLACCACRSSEHSTESSHTVSVQRPDDRGRIRIAITANGFVPEETRITVGEPVTLVVTRLVHQTCAQDLVLEQFGIETPLPLGVPVEVRFTPLEPGRVRFVACPINWVAGELVAE